MKRPIIIVIAVVVVLGIIGAFIGGDNEESIQESESVVGENNVVEDNPGNDASVEDNTIDGYSVPQGELLEVNATEDEGKSWIVFKVKTNTLMNNKQTIDQNYYNVEDLIKQGASKYDEIQYWAVAQSTGGDDVKYISFTMDKELIDRVAAGNFPVNTLGDYVQDLYILPSLLD